MRKLVPRLVEVLPVVQLEAVLSKDVAVFERQVIDVLEVASRPRQLVGDDGGYEQPIGTELGARRNRWALVSSAVEVDEIPFGFADADVSRCADHTTKSMQAVGHLERKDVAFPRPDSRWPEDLQIGLVSHAYKPCERRNASPRARASAQYGWFGLMLRLTFRKTGFG